MNIWIGSLEIIADIICPVNFKSSYKNISLNVNQPQSSFKDAKLAVSSRT